ncbi:MAG: hypothetical protein IJH75_08915 [Mogibacterium sp.]|nr:hypothetical protein [Mogibacterium sp.]
MKIHNDPEDIRIRRARNLLIIVGTGIIALGAWSFAKSVLLLLTDRASLYALAAETAAQDGVFSEQTAYGIILAVILLATLLDISVRLYVGRSAIAEGMGRKRSRLYILLTCIMILFSLLLLIFGIATFFFKADGQQAEGSVSFIIIELTSLIMMSEMVVSAVRVRKHRSQEASQ